MLWIAMVFVLLAALAVVASLAVGSGSPVKLQTWAHVVHVWHMFYPQLTEARLAWDEIEEFFKEIG